MYNLFVLYNKLFEINYYVCTKSYLLNKIQYILDYNFQGKFCLLKNITVDVFGFFQYYK